MHHCCNVVTKIAEAASDPIANNGYASPAIPSAGAVCVSRTRASQRDSDNRAGAVCNRDRNTFPESGLGRPNWSISPRPGSAA